VAWLEEVSRERATSRLRQAWASLTDEEVAVVLAPYAEWVQYGEPTEEEKEVRGKARDAMPEELIATAIGFTERMESEEIDWRIHSLVGELGIFERGKGIRRHLSISGEVGT